MIQWNIWVINKDITETKQEVILKTTYAFSYIMQGEHSYFNFPYLCMLNGVGKSLISSLSHMQSLQFNFHFWDESQFY